MARRDTSYERLEFLGDSVLGLVIAHHLYERFPESPEGDLAKVRAHVVSRDSCAAVAIEVGLDDDVRARGAQLGAAQVEIDGLSHSPGVLAAVTQVLGEHGISIKSMVQRGMGQNARLVMVTHSVLESRLRRALQRVAEFEFVRASPRMIRVIEEEFV